LLKESDLIILVTKRLAHKNLCLFLDADPRIVNRPQVPAPTPPTNLAKISGNGNDDDAEQQPASTTVATTGEEGLPFPGMDEPSTQENKVSEDSTSSGFEENTTTEKLGTFSNEEPEEELSTQTPTGKEGDEELGTELGTNLDGEQTTYA